MIPVASGLLNFDEHNSSQITSDKGVPVSIAKTAMIFGVAL